MMKQPALPERISGGIIGGQLRKGLWYEQKMLAYIQSLKIPGLYLDIGANIGNHSLFFALNTPADHILAFEPVACNRLALHDFVAANDTGGKISIVPFAVSDTRGSTSFTIARGIGERREKENVLASTVRIDDVAPDGVTLAKMDIEGMEPSALRGMTRVLSQDRPRLFIEANSDEKREEIDAIVAPFGYKRTGRFWNASPTYEWVSASE